MTIDIYILYFCIFGLAYVLNKVINKHNKLRKEFDVLTDKLNNKFRL